MKRCPECRRDYYDDSLSFCLDDGAHLLDGPRSDEKSTALLPASVMDLSDSHDTDEKSAATAVLSSNIAATFRSKRLMLIIGVAVITPLLLFFAYDYFFSSGRQAGSVNVVAPTPAVKLYWEMRDEEKFLFISEQSKHVEKLIGDEPTEFESTAVLAIRDQIDDYVEDKDSLSQKPGEEGLRAIYGRATQFAPTVIRAFDEQKVPAALGLYQAMVESEYHDCPDLNWEHPGRAPVGLFQFSRNTAGLYGLLPADYCNVQKQCDAAARHMSDLISDFGAEKSSWTLALFSFNQGADGVRDYLRQLRANGITERSFWSIFRHKTELRPPMTEEANRYVPRFFAAAIIGENPAVFELSTPPLTTLRK
ncbi:MAG: transglycosylase SLT domain-containing protein [Pyrinomonadaceae bacterium]